MQPRQEMQLIDLQYVAAYVISSGSGDRCGLSELLAAIASRRPGATDDEILEACLAACLALVGEGHVQLEMTPAHAERPGRGGYTQISSDAVEAILREPQAWQSPRDARPRYWLVATEAGRAAYVSEGVISL